MSSAAKVGIFMLVILAILGYFVLKIEDIDVTRGRNTREVTVLFDNVAGLDEKSAVRVAGVRKGKVTHVQLRPDGKAAVTLQIDDDVPLRSNATANVTSLGLLGEKYVELDPGTPPKPLVTSDKVVISGSQSASIDDVTNQVSAIATDVKAITASLRGAISGPAGQQRIEDIVENVRTVTEQMKLLVSANRESVDATVANMRALTADLRVQIPKLAASIDRVANTMGNTVGENREDVRRIVENLRTLSSDLKTGTANVNAITGQMKSGEGTVGKLLYSDEAHDRLTTTLKSIEGGVGELRNTLGRVNKIGLDIGVKSDYLAGMKKQAPEFENIGGTSRSAVNVLLRPNPENNRFYNIELSDDPRGKRRDKVIVETVIEQGGGSHTTTTKTTKFDRAFLVSAQAGWLFDNIGVRVGLIDSMGGVGADYNFNERLRVTGEAFDFGGKRDDNPHVRLFGEYIFRKEKANSPRLFVTSGVDNPLNDTAIILGGGLRWKDDDLKYLLGSLPIGK